MEIDPERMRYLFPLDRLGRKSIKYLADRTRVLELTRGDTLFRVGDQSPYVYYVIQGKALLVYPTGERKVVDGATDDARFALGNLLPRRMDAVAASRRTLIARIDRDLFDKELAWGQMATSPNEGKPMSKQALEAESEEREWKLSLLRTPLFFNLPMANVQALFEKLEEIPVKAGQVIVQEGDPGDYFYLIRRGQCKVIRKAGELEVQLNRLQEWDSFGDEALVSDRPRRATVIMETDGVLRRLTKADFQQLMKAPILKRVDYPEARKWVEAGQAVLVDVRMEDEFAENRLRDSVSIPLYLLYLKCHGLTRGLRYVFYCDTGHRSEAAAFMMTQKGFKTYVLNRAGEALAADAPDTVPNVITSTEPLLGGKGQR